MGEKIKKFLLSEQSTKIKNNKMLKRLHELDGVIDDFIDSLEEEINSTKDNPIFIRKCNQLLADMSKEYSEFMSALRSVVNAVDRKSKLAPMFKKQESKVRDVRSNIDGGEESPPEEEMEENNSIIRGILFKVNESYR